LSFYFVAIQHQNDGSFHNREGQPLLLVCCPFRADFETVKLNVSDAQVLTEFFHLRNAKYKLMKAKKVL
jgi:hypothetical protein